jgi:photosystem II stability/assembly factor-like uncharacterized protein
MKKTVLVFLAVLFSSIVYSQSGWVRVTDSIPNLQMYAIQFTSQSTGYASGCYNGYTPGTLFKTTNTGMNWQVTQLLNYSGDDISFLDDNTGFFVGSSHYYSYIFKTTNGGNNWIIQDSIYGTFKIKFFDYNTGFVAAKYSQIKKTTNGGANWFSQTGVNWGEPSSLICIDANTWLVASYSNLLNKTTNGGINWNVLNFSSIGFESQALYFINSTTGFCATHNGKIFKTTNTGDNWFQISNVTNTNIWSTGNLHFVNDNTGYLSGRSDSGSVFKTTNGGYNWVIQKPIPNTLFLALYFINATTGFVGGNHGYIFKTTNGGSVFVSNISSEVPEKFSLGQNYPNPFNPTTKIRFSIVNGFPIGAFGNDKAVLKVYDVMGREVLTLVNERLQPGTYEASFDGSALNSGVYFYRLITEGYCETKKMLLIK